MRQSLKKLLLHPLSNLHGGAVTTVLILTSLVLSAGAFYRSYTNETPSQHEVRVSRELMLYPPDSEAEKARIAMIRQTYDIARQHPLPLKGPCWLYLLPENPGPGEEVSITLGVAKPLFEKPLNITIDDVSCSAGEQAFTLPSSGGVYDYTVPTDSNAVLVSCTATSDRGGTTICEANAWISPHCSPADLIHGQLYVIYHSLYGSDGREHCLTEAERDSYDYNNGGFDVGWTSSPKGPCKKCP